MALDGKAPPGFFRRKAAKRTKTYSQNNQIRRGLIQGAFFPCQLHKYLLVSFSDCGSQLVPPIVIVRPVGQRSQLGSTILLDLIFAIRPLVQPDN
jgi:hypothetical protein